jgi:hypothetical protein
MEKIKLSINKLCNLDETAKGVTIQNIEGHELERKASICQPFFCRKGCLVTVAACKGASGQFVPPLLVFLRKNVKLGFLDREPLGTIAAFPPSGFLQLDIFIVWFKHYVSVVEPISYHPFVLILNGHYSYTQSIDINISCKHVLCVAFLSPHFTHRIQTLDITFTSPFRSYWRQEVEMWLKIRTLRSNCYILPNFTLGGGGHIYDLLL